MKSFEDDGRKLKREHSGVEHHAIDDLKHDGVRVTHDERMPDVVRAAEIEHERDAHEDVPEKGREHRGPDDGMKTLDVEDMDGCSESEAAGGKHDAAKHVEANPNAPGELVTEICRFAQPLAETDDGRVETHGHSSEENKFPECRPSF